MPFNTDELRTLAPRGFLNWEQFRTGWLFELDAWNRSTQYAKGLAIGNSSQYVAIAYNGTWSARGKDGSLTSSYEVIGYHAGTADLLHGFLDSGVPVVVYRESDANGESEWIQGSHHETAQDIGRTDRPKGAASPL